MPHYGADSLGLNFGRQSIIQSEFFWLVTAWVRSENSTHEIGFLIFST